MFRQPNTGKYESIAGSPSGSLSAMLELAAFCPVCRPMLGTSTSPEVPIKTLSNLPSLPYKLCRTNQ